jgi:hypothetical protein
LSPADDGESLEEWKGFEFDRCHQRSGQNGLIEGSKVKGRE